MFTRVTNKCIDQIEAYTPKHHKVLIKRATMSEWVKFRNQNQNMLFKLSLHANSMAMCYWQV